MRSSTPHRPRTPQRLMSFGSFDSRSRRGSHDSTALHDPTAGETVPVAVAPSQISSVLSSNRSPLSVCVRMRAVLSQDSRLAASQRRSSEVCVYLQNDGQSIKLLQDAYHFKTFKADHTFGASSNQQEVYQRSLRPLVREVLSGFNATCMVYGQTASGKTYTMFGNESIPGIAHLALRDVFLDVARREDVGLVSKVYVSFYQIYLENVYDLLGDVGVRFDRITNTTGGYGNGGSQATNFGANWSAQNVNSVTQSLDIKHQSTLPSLSVREDTDKRAFVENLRYCLAKDADHAAAIIEQGLQRRRVNSTSYNIASSRSHAILQIHCDFEESPQDDGVFMHDSPASDRFGSYGQQPKKRYTVRRRTLTLVDLAGSERVQTHKQHTSKRQLQEAAVINKSIAALGNCIYALSKSVSNSNTNGIGALGSNGYFGGATASGRESIADHIPYRDCKLTRLLADSLGGQTKTCIIATISPCHYNYEETCSTLKFSERARIVVKTTKKPKTTEIVIQPDSPIATKLAEFAHEDAPNEECNVLHENDDEYIDESLIIGERCTIELYQSEHLEDQAEYEKWNAPRGGEQHSNFTLREFLRACTVAQRLADHPPESMNSVRPQLMLNDAASDTSSLTSVAFGSRGALTPRSSRRLQSEDFVLDTDFESPPLHVSELHGEPTASKIDDEANPAFTPIRAQNSPTDRLAVDGDVNTPAINKANLETTPLHTGDSPVPRTEPIIVKQKALQSSNVKNTPPPAKNGSPSLPSTAKKASGKGKDLHVEIPHTPLDEAIRSAAKRFSVISPPKVKTASKEVQTQPLSIQPSLLPTEFNGSLDDFGCFIAPSKVHQSTSIDSDALLHSDPNLIIETAEQEELLRLAQLSPFELALMLLQTQDSLAQMENKNKLLQELVIDESSSGRGGSR